MRNTLTLIFIFSLSSLFAQEPAKNMLEPCGTPAGISPWLRFYSDHKAEMEYRSNDTLWVGLQAHLLARDNGTGRFPFDRFMDALCRLNTDFAESNIQFYLKDDINLIDNSAWYAHTTIPAGIDMMLTNNVDDAFNSYFVGNPAGNCGYNLPYGGVAIGHSCASASDHTWAHEAGHALSLPHPFIGWEGKQYNYAIPTPTSVTYDYTYFHDTIDTQIPAPLDTALVEYVDGSNCAIASDLICDTKPDYISSRWTCNGQGMSPAIQKDPAGVDFQSDGSLFMSYADDACQTRFSPEEIQVMRANLATEKANWLGSAPQLGEITQLVNQISPIQDQVVPVAGTQLVWSSAPNATHYVVEASRFSSYALREVEMITSDTFVTTPALLANRTYYWRVKAFNAAHFCADLSESATFVTAPTSAAFEPDSEGWRCYPTVLSPGHVLNLEIPESWLGKTSKVACYDVAGNLKWDSKLLISGYKMMLQVPLENWQTGLYYLVLSNEMGIKRQALMIAK